MARRRVRLRVVTWNAHIAKKRRPWKRRLNRAEGTIAHIAQRSDLAVFQEFGQHPDMLDFPGHTGWDPRGSKPPHLWRNAAVRAADHGSRLMAPGRRVGRTPGFRAELGDYECSVGRYVVDGLLVVLIGVHLPAHVERPAGEVQDTARGRMWSECVQAVADLADDERDLGADVVLVLGDWNMRLAAGQPFRPLLRLGARKIRPGEATHRFREIDGGFALTADGVDVKVVDCHVMRGRRMPHLPGRWFDHRPVHATLEITTQEKP